MAPIQSKHVEDPISVSEHNDRGVGKPDIPIAMPRDDGARGMNILGGERLQAISPAGHLVEEAEFGIETDSGC